MSSAPILVDYAQLTAAELAMAASQRQITAALAALDRDLAPLLATWEGDGKQAYLRQQQKWNAAADELNRTLAAVHTTVGEANRRYQDTTGGWPRPGVASDTSAAPGGTSCAGPGACGPAGLRTPGDHREHGVGTRRGDVAWDDRAMSVDARPGSL